MTMTPSCSVLHNVPKKILFLRMSSFFANIKLSPPDAILGLNLAFNKDKREEKINVGVGAYRDDDGNPYILPVVKKALERIMEKNMNHEYCPIEGSSAFIEPTVRLALGKECKTIEDKRYATVQSISGTGSLRLGALFLSKYKKGPKVIHIPDPTWGNHIAIFEHSGLFVNRFKYYNPETISFDFEGCSKYLAKIPKKSTVLMHACAHNPTGVDPTEEQWDELSILSKEKELLIYFDMAYQGFASGSFEKDAYAVRKFIRDGNDIILSQSFAKNMGLYGERVGAFTVIGDSKENAANILSQLKILIRSMYSSPPIHGARIVTEVLNDDELMDEWLIQVKEMADRINSIRKLLRKTLEDFGSPRPWNHITQQIGMFAFTGLKPEEVARMAEEFGIYMTQDGRVSMAGINTKNVKYMAESILSVIS